MEEIELLRADVEALKIICVALIDKLGAAVLSLSFTGVTFALSRVTR
jgi:hypothetical protein